MSNSALTLTIFLSCALAVAGCGDDTPTPGTDSGGTDSGRTDSGGTDSGGTDSGGTDTLSADTGMDAGAMDPTYPPLPAGASQDALERAYIVFGTCVPDDGVLRNLNRFYDNPRLSFLSLSLEQITCLSTMNIGCVTVEACLGLTVDLAGPCVGSCEGNRLTVCDDTLRISADCTSFGLTCDAAQAACVDETAPACDGDGFDIRCEEGRPVGCEDGRERYGYTCSDFGLTCDTSGCTGAGAACDSMGSSTFGLLTVGTGCADAETLNACVNSGTHTIRCADLAAGVSCQTVGETSFCGRGSECTPDRGSATCDGDTLVFCHAGQTAMVDCTSLGFTGCLDDDGRDGAHCSPRVGD